MGGDLHHALYCVLADKRAVQVSADVDIDSPAGTRETADMDKLVLDRQIINEVLHEQAKAWPKKGK